MAREMRKLKKGTSENAVVDDADRKLQIKTIAKYVMPERIKESDSK
jgi:hypothetical protein